MVLKVWTFHAYKTMVLQRINFLDYHDMAVIETKTEFSDVNLNRKTLNFKYISNFMNKMHQVAIKYEIVHLLSTIYI